jgi:hypothetical protein
MTNTTNFLNQIAAAMGTKDKTIVINTAVAMLVKSGVDLETAFDMIVGEGAYKKLAGDVWTALRAKAAA